MVIFTYIIITALVLNALTQDDNDGDTLDTYGFDWSSDYEEWDFYVQYATQSGDQKLVQLT